MLTSFDWIRRSRTGAELLAILRYLKIEQAPFLHQEMIGPPHSALNSPCQRCRIYPRAPRSDGKDNLYCIFCREIVSRSGRLGPTSRRSMIIWGSVNQLPEQFQNGNGAPRSQIHGSYLHDDSHFLVMMYRRKLRPWFQELVLYNGANLRGLIQIFPTTGPGKETSMGDILCRAIHHDANFPMDQLRVRFYSSPYQLLRPHTRERQGLLTFEVSEFLRSMEMAEVFRALLKPEEQQALHELLGIDDSVEKQFYWGRLVGHLTQEAKDMLSAWRIRTWPESRIRLLYELVDYVYLPGFR